MPSLILFGQSSVFAGDDIRFVTRTIILFRIAQLFLALPLMVYLVSHPSVHDEYDIGREDCEEYQDEFEVDYSLVDHVWILTMFYFPFSVFLSLAGLAVFIPLDIISGRGSPTQTDERKQITPLCHLHLGVFNVLRVVAFFVGLTLLSALYQYCRCSRDSHQDVTDKPFEGIRRECVDFQNEWMASFFGCVVTHFIDTIYATLTVLHLFMQHCCEQRATNLSSIQARWECCCRCCLGCFSFLSCHWFCCECCTDEDDIALETWNTQDLKILASILTDFLDDDDILDVTPSDVFAGLVMLHLLHVEQEQQLRDRLLTYAQEASTELVRRSPNKEKVIRKDGKEVDSATNQANSDIQDDGAEEEETSSDEDDKVTDTSAKHLSNILEQFGNRLHYHQSLADSSEHPPDILELLKSVARTTTVEAADAANTSNGSGLRRGRMSVAFRHRDQEKSFAPVVRETLAPENPYERYLVAEGARFIWHAEAIYVWSVSDRDGLNCRGSPPPYLPSTKAEPEEVPTESDHAGHALERAPILLVRDEDVVFAQYRQGIAATPYAIVLDHAWKSVVVTIRGTQSLEDMLADLMVVPTELTDVGEQCGFDGKGRSAHSGVLACSQWIYDDIRRHGWLDKLLSAEDATYPSYRLRITGHSLGAGCAVLLSLMLRSKFKNVRCLAFSPPGCTVCAKLAEESTAWTTSFILDSDIVPRSSLEALEMFRDEVLEMIARIRISKYRVLEQQNLDLTGTREELVSFLKEALWDKDSVPSSPFLDQLQAFRTYAQSKAAERQVNHSFVPLCTPGKLIQLIRTVTPLNELAQGCCAPGTGERSSGVVDMSSAAGEHAQDPFSYTARWAEREDLSRIALSSHLLIDHQTADVKAQLSHLASIYKLAEPYSRVLSESVDI